MSDGDGLGKRLRRAIEASGKSINRVADETGTARAHITRILKDETRPGAEKLIALADATGASVDELLGRRPTAALPIADAGRRPIPAKVEEWGRWMERLPGDAREIVIRVGDAIRGAHKAPGVGTSPTRDTSHRSRRKKAGASG